MTLSEAETPTLDAKITYLAPGSFINRRFVAAGHEVNTGSYQDYPVVVRDARPNAQDFTLQSHGFTLLKHESKVKDFLDPAEVASIYGDEVAQAVKQLTGADMVAILGRTIVRSSGDLAQRNRARENPQDSVQPPGAEAHVDTAPDRADRMAAAIYRQRFPDAPPYKRYIYASFWRTFSDPPQDYPLALCDGNSVADDEGETNTMFVVEKMPTMEEMLQPIPDEDKAMAAAIFRHNPNHRWWYFSNMTRDEALYFAFHDSRRVRPWRVPHTAFFDASRPDAKTRESVEQRSIAYFL